ncbi:MAG: pyrophosphate--fructose-6-phosphate 1-phosphotransferase [Myxococcota bacterium]|nr:pyrophosphate--fructose-6-phosphate 1-phosphotransferase [Myxococcota bacterium]
MAEHRVGILTAGGLAPCLSAATGALIEHYTELDPTIEILCYRSGYKGLLLGDCVSVSSIMRERARVLKQHGGSPIGNSRVKLTNVEDCVKRELVREGESPLARAAEQLERDGVTILHTIGGDDTNIMAAALAEYLAEHDYPLTVVGLPKTVDNDVFPIGQSLGAATAAEQGARFFENVVNESSANPRMLIIHEVMGRNCGWLTAATARAYRARLGNLELLPEIGLSRSRKDIHAVWLPEVPIAISEEATRLRAIMDEIDCVNIFLSEGAGVESIVEEMKASGQDVPRDAFGHVKLDKINPGEWFAKQFSERVGAEKVLVQKSGYFARSAAANAEDLALIESCAELAVHSALEGIQGVVGHDEDQGGELRAIEFSRIRGGKPFDASTPWFAELLSEIGQRS